MAGPDGNLWFSQFLDNKVSSITLSGMITSYHTSGNPSAVTVGGDGNIWFLEGAQDMIGRVTIATGTVTEFPAAGLFYPQGDVEGLTLGPDGNVWFTDPVNHTIGFITPAGDVTEQQGLPYAPFGIITGPDGNLWFTVRSSFVDGHLTPTGIGTMSSSFTNFTQYNIRLRIRSRQPHHRPGSQHLVRGSGSQHDKPHHRPGKITAYPLPYSGSTPVDVAAGPDGNLWITEATGNRVARVTTNGAVRDVLMAQPFSNPEGITTGPDGRIWFAEADRGTQGWIAALDPSTLTPPPPPCLVATH